MIHQPDPVQGRKTGKPSRNGRTPSEGIYYVIRTPEGWRLTLYRYQTANVRHPEIHHVEFWQAMVAPSLASAWAQACPDPARRPLLEARLRKQLHELYYAFPRGRIDRGNGTVFIVRNGNNLNRKMPARLQIERAFQIQGVCEWEFDSHEQCMDEDAAEIREILKLKDAWISVGPQE